MATIEVHGVSLDPGQYVVINDGAFQFPVERSSLRVGDTEARLKGMSGDQYRAWCDEVGMDERFGVVGEQGCIDVCEALKDAGADAWYIG